MSIELIDSYSESNYNITWYLYIGSYISLGQSINNLDAGVLDSAKFYLRKLGSPTGSIYTKLYAMSGTFGSTGVPSGVALATSDAVDISGLTTSYQLITFNFSDTNRIELEADTYYVIQVEYNGGDGDNCLMVGYDSSSSTHDGNISYYNGSSWFFSLTNDCIFYVYREVEEEIENTGNFFAVLYP